MSTGKDTIIWHLAEAITCHAWNKDKTKLAICPNTNEIWIYTNCQVPDATKWKKEAILTEHDMVISSMDWSHVHDKLVTCSHDRNAFVWTYERTYRKWTPTAVVLRIPRAAIMVKWSPNGQKFAVASSAKCVSVCRYRESESWWDSKMIKKHKSTVLDLDWHPNSQLLVTGSTDLKCRVFSARIPELDGPEDAGPFSTLAPFGEMMAEFDSANAWVNAVAWAPSGDRLVFAGQGSSIHFVQFPAKGQTPTVQSIRFSHLPLLRTKFLSPDAVIGVGFDFNPLLFAKDSNGYWSFIETLDKKVVGGAAKRSAGAFSDARSMWESKVSRGQSSEATQGDKDALWTKHESAITAIQPYEYGANGIVTQFTTSALDGRIVHWSLNNLSSGMRNLSLRA